MLRHFAFSLLLLTLGAGLALADVDAGAPPQLTRAPALAHFVEAVYPPEAEAAHLEATVTLQLDLDASGAVTQVVVLQPAGHGFDEAAVAAARQFVFTPAELDFKPAAVQLTYAYKFVFRAPPEPDAGPASESAPAPREGPVNLSGTVLERGTRRPLVGAQVAIPALQQESVADATGHFAFRDVPLGPVALVVSVPGYQRFETTETLAAGQETRATYYVQKAYFSQFETVVRGRKERKEVSQQTISVEETQKVPGTQGDTLKVVQDLPGVARSSFGLGALVIRGTSANDSGVFLDGVEIPLLYHFGGLTSVYNSDLLESIAYLPGNYSTYYGDLIGGVVDVKSRSPRKDRWGGYANLSLLEASLVLEGPVTDDISVSISGRRSYIDATLKAAPASTQSMFSVAPRYYDAQAKVEWRINSKHTLTLLGITSDDNLELLFDRPSDTDPTVAGKFHLETGFSQLRLKHQYRNGNWRVDTIGVLGRINLLIAPGTVQIFQLTSTEYNLRSNVEYELGPSLTLAGGVDEVYDRASIVANVARPAEEGEPVQPGGRLISVKAPFYQYFPSLYAEARWKPVEGLQIIPGLRTESYVFTDQSKADRSVSPRLGIRYDLNSEWGFKGGAGVYHGTATQAEPTKAFGNPDIKSKESDQFSLGAEWHPAFYSPLLVTVEGFYNKLSNLIVANPDPQGFLKGEPLLLNEGIGRIYGVEVLVRHQLSERFFGWIAYTLSKSERKDAADQPWRLFDTDQTHVLTVIGSYKLPYGFDIGARFRYASGNPFTPVVGARRNDDTDVYSPIYGLVNSQRQPSFNQADIRIDKTFVFDLWSLDLYLDVQNVYNNASVEGVSYSYNYAQRAYFTGLPILPIVGAKGSF